MFKFANRYLGLLLRGLGASRSTSRDPGLVGARPIPSSAFIMKFGKKLGGSAFCSSSKFLFRLLAHLCFFLIITTTKLQLLLADLGPAII